MQLSLTVNPHPSDASSSAPTAAIRVCSLDELPVGLGRAFEIADRTIAIFRTRSGALLAMDNRCPHKGGPLAEGMLAGESVVCPLHSFRFDGTTGECDQPGVCAVTTYPVQQKEDGIYIALTPRSDRPKGS